MPTYEYGVREISHLKKQDRRLGRLIDRIGPIEREVIPDLFCALVHGIVGQQVAAKAAATVWKRLGTHCGEITPEALADADPAAIQKCGLSMRKAFYLKGIGEAVLTGALDIAALAGQEDGEIIKRLSALNGVGVWTAEMLLLFSLQRPDVVSWGDLAIRRGMMQLYGLTSLSRDQFERHRKRYTPYGSVASLYLWALAAEKD